MPNSIWTKRTRIDPNVTYDSSFAYDSNTPYDVSRFGSQWNERTPKTTSPQSGSSKWIYDVVAKSNKGENLGQTAIPASVSISDAKKLAPKGKNTKNLIPVDKKPT